MSKNRYAPNSGGNDGDAAQIYEHLNKITADELIDEMTDIWDAMDDEHFNPQVIDSYLTALDKRYPVASEYNAKASLSAFREKHAVLFAHMEPAAISSKSTPQLRRFRHWRVLRLIAAIIIVMLGCMITAQAFGVDVFGAIARWTEETFHFSTPSQTEDDQASTDSEGSGYSSLQNALQSYGIIEDIAPNWYPPGFQLISVKVTPTQESVKFQAAYQASNRFLSISIWQMESSEEVANVVFEKDAQDIVLYELNEVKHYIMSNNGQITVAWSINSFVCSLSGDITVDDAKKIINSIYER